MRLRNKPWAEDFIKKNPHIVEKSPVKWRGRWQDKFNENLPLHVEVGTGKGRFITEMAQSHPDINFIGVEKYESVIVTGVERVIDNPLANIQFLQEDVKDITDFFAEGEVDLLYINFTDPWPKTKHAKRRLTHPFFLEKYQQILKTGGEVHFKTDNQGLFEYSIESMSQFGFKLKNISLDLHNSGMQGNVMTEYEEKFSAKGMRIYRLEAELEN